MIALPDFVQHILDHFGSRVMYGGAGIDMHCIQVTPEHVVDLCRYLKKQTGQQFNFLSDMCGVDYFPAVNRYEVVYHLFSIPQQHRLRVKCRLVDPADGDLPTLPTVTGVWRTANWHEREAFDMYGIVFEGHPNLQRIYMWDEFEGYPMRKDFPVRGYKDDYNPFGDEKEGQT